MKEYIKRAKIVKSSRIKFLASWAEKLLDKHSVDEIRHAVKVFAQNRFKVSEKTARHYAKETIRLLNLSAEKKKSKRKMEKKPRKTRIIRVRVDDKEYKILKEAAEERNGNISIVIRELIKTLKE